MKHPRRGLPGNVRGEDGRAGQHAHGREPNDQSRMGVNDVGDGARVDGVPPRVEVPAKPIRQPTWLAKGIPQFARRPNPSLAEVNDERVTVLPPKPTHFDECVAAADRDRQLPAPPKHRLDRLRRWNAIRAARERIAVTRFQALTPCAPQGTS